MIFVPGATHVRILSVMSWTWGTRPYYAPAPINTKTDFCRLSMCSSPFPFVRMTRDIFAKQVYQPTSHIPDISVQSLTEE